MERVAAGVYRTRELYRSIGRASVERLRREKKAKILRRGWIQVGEPPIDVVTAVTRGGVLSCLSALKWYGVWTPPFVDVHARGNKNAIVDRPEAFCRCYGRPCPEYGAIDDVPTALAHTVHCLDDAGLVVVIDSILHLQLMSLEEIEYLFRDAPERIQRVLSRVDGRAESGGESLVRYGLECRNVKLDIQVTIDGVGRVDILVGRWLIIEIDGWEYHGDELHFDADRTRIVEANARGYTLLPFSSRQVLYDWDATMGRIMTAIRQGAHTRPCQLSELGRMDGDEVA